MILKEKESMIIQDLQTQEKACIEKYTRYSKEAKDPVLQKLFTTIADKERTHLDSLQQVLDGACPKCDVNDTDGRDYDPEATYAKNDTSTDKTSDCFLATDCIGTEKMVSGTYNDDVFIFGNSEIRKLLADIQVEEQNHAEMLWKYKTVNGMA